LLDHVVGALENLTAVRDPARHDAGKIADIVLAVDERRDDLGHVHGLPGQHADQGGQRQDDDEQRERRRCDGGNRLAAEQASNSSVERIKQSGEHGREHHCLQVRQDQQEKQHDEAAR